MSLESVTPPAGVDHVGALAPFDVNTCPAVPAADKANADAVE